MCPECREPMAVIDIGGVEVDWCAGCGGVWLDEGELEFLFELSGVPPEAPPALPLDAPPGGKTAFRCPRCNRKLEAVTMGEDPAGRVVELDRCRMGHGLWFQAGEIEAVTRLLHGEAGEALRGLFQQLKPGLPSGGKEE